MQGMALKSLEAGSARMIVNSYKAYFFSVRLLKQIFQNMYMSRSLIRSFLHLLLPHMLCHRVASLFLSFFIVVYICEPMAFKAPMSSEKGLLHPTILVRCDRGKLSEVV